MRISIKLLLVSLIFVISITISLIITLILFTRGNTAIEREVDELAQSGVALSLLKLEAKLERAHAALQTVSNATVTRFVPSVFPNSTKAALDVMIRVSLMIYDEWWSFTSATVVHNNGDLVFTRSRGTPPQIIIAKSNAFWNGSAANTPSFATRWNETRFQYNFSTLQEIPTNTPAWDTVGVTRGAFVHAPNWNSTARQEPNTPQMLQVTPSHLLARRLNRTEAIMYYVSVPIFEDPSSASSRVGKFSAVKSLTSMPLVLDVVADNLKEFLIGDVSRSKLFVVDTNTLNSGGVEKVISQTPGGLTFETRDYTPGMHLPQGCFPARSKMGCFYNVSTHNDFHLLKHAIAQGLPFDLPLNSSGSSSEIRSIHFEDDRDGTEYVASVGKLSLRSYNALKFRVYFFTPLDFFSGDLRRALNISLAISFVIAAVVSIVGGYLGLHLALRGVEILAEKMYRDPWAATKTEKQELKEMLKHSTDEYQSFWAKKFQKNTEKKDQKKKNSSKTNKDDDNKKQHDDAVESLSSSFQEVLELEAEFVAFRSVIDLIRGFVVASGGLMPASKTSFSATNSSTLPSDVQQNQHSGELNNNNSSTVDINKNNDNDNNKNDDNNNNHHGNGDTFDNSDGSVSGKKKRSVRFTAETVGGTDDEDGGDNDKNEKMARSSLTRGSPARQEARESAPPECAAALALRQRHPFFVATIRFMLLDWFDSSATSSSRSAEANTTQSGDRSSETVGRYDSSNPPSSSARSLQSGGKLLDTDNKFADVRESFDSRKTSESNDATQQQKNKNTNKHSPSLFDVSTLFHKLDSTCAFSSSSSLGAASSSRQHTTSSIATTKLLFSRIISIACSVLLQSCGLSVLQFFGDSMICYFRLRNFHSTSNLVLRFIGILHRLQQQLGEGRYRERFSTRHDISSDNSSKKIAGHQQQEQAMRSQELAIRNFLSNEVLSGSVERESATTATDTCLGGTTSTSEWSNRTHHRASSSQREKERHDDEDDDDDDDDRRSGQVNKQEAYLGNFSDRLVLKIVAGFSAGDLRVLDSSRIVSTSSPVGKSERAKSKNMNNIRAPAVQSSSSSSDRVEFSLLGDALGESFYLADQAPSLFFAPLSSSSSSSVSGAARGSRSRQKPRNSHHRERTSVDKTNNNWFNVVVQPQGPQSLAAILEYDAASTTSFCPLIVMPLLLQRAIAQTPARLVFDKESRIQKGIPLVEVANTKKIRVPSADDLGAEQDSMKFGNFVNALAEDMDEDWLSSNITTADAEKAEVNDDEEADDDGIQVLQRENRKAIQSKKYINVQICKILCEL